jgi:hypothetical protein
MSPDVLIIRFPDGSREFRFPEKMLEVDDVVWHDGEHYRVISVSPDGSGPHHAAVELASPGLGDLLQSEEGAIRLMPTEA